MAGLQRKEMKCPLPPPTDSSCVEYRASLHSWRDLVFLTSLARGKSRHIWTRVLLCKLQYSQLNLAKFNINCWVCFSLRRGKCLKFRLKKNESWYIGIILDNRKFKSWSLRDIFHNLPFSVKSKIWAQKIDTNVDYLKCLIFVTGYFRFKLFLSFVVGGMKRFNLLNNSWFLNILLREER